VVRPVRSIIQGVALAALVQRVEGTYRSFAATSWIMTATTFLAILVIWHEYLVQVMGYVWTPTLIDSIVPFAFVGGEVFMTHFVANDLRNWLLASGATFLVAVAAWVVGWRQARLGRGENRAVFRSFPKAHRLRGILPGALGLLGIAGWARYDALGFSRSQVIAAIGMLSLLAVYVAISIPYWSHVAAHAPRH